MSLDRLRPRTDTTTPGRLVRHSRAKPSYRPPVARGNQVASSCAFAKRGPRRFLHRPQFPWRWVHDLNIAPCACAKRSYNAAIVVSSVATKNDLETQRKIEWKRNRKKWGRARHVFEFLDKRPSVKPSHSTPKQKKQTAKAKKTGKTPKSDLVRTSYGVQVRVARVTQMLLEQQEYDNGVKPWMTQRNFGKNTIGVISFACFRIPIPNRIPSSGSLTVPGT